MGGTYWSDNYYADREADRVKTGKTAFTYDVAMKSAPVSARKVHEKCDPYGVKFRESRDSDAHPNSVAIAVMFDVTGSMQTVPMVLQKKLGQLMGLLLRKSYVVDPQILFGTIGDATCDPGSLQVGQFESGIEMDDDLGRLWLVGGGGGSNEESYQNALYFFARHTAIDCWEKRGHKGYLFIIGDEKPYPKVSRAQVKSLIGDDLQDDIPVKAIIREVQERYHVFYVLPKGTSNYDHPEIETTWKGLLSPENFIKLEDPESVCESIGVAIGLIEGTVDMSAAEADLKAAGVPKRTIDSVGRGLDSLAKSTALTRVGTGNLPEKAGRSKTNVRL